MPKLRVKKPKLTKCIVCGKPKLKWLGKKEVKCNNCQSQYSYSRLMKVTSKE